MDEKEASAFCFVAVEVTAGSSWQACSWTLDLGDGCRGSLPEGPPNPVAQIGEVLGISLGAAHMQW